jgi:hypothetical protein
MQIFSGLDNYQKRTFNSQFEFVVNSRCIEFAFKRFSLLVYTSMKTHIPIGFEVR